ncbi:MAG: SCP2 sterol-binding domain-containing protein [Sorangiineae bacterium]|nr:SCP2 sterol-binding domain-containing protein [Polyangiaceae bacterium]MEB2322965.1 SCP2 sterol-binding domain-containing protein [Sorangiineae bacterium]
MSVIYSEAWYDDMKQLINGSAEFRKIAPTRRMAMALEVLGDSTSPYVPAEARVDFLIVLDGGEVTDYKPLEGRHDGKGLDFRFTAPATVWEGIAAGELDPITAGLRGKIKIRGDMRFLMQNADAVKLLVDLYGHQISTDWPKGKPPYS